MSFRILPLLVIFLLGGCTSLTRPNLLASDRTVILGPSVSYPVEKIVYWGIYAGAAYLILEPWAPNWDIEQAQFPHDQYHLSLHMKRYYAGGAGEARVVFRRRAEELARERGFDGYEVLEYTEGMESSVIGSMRTAEGVIRLTKADEG